MNKISIRIALFVSTMVLTVVMPWWVFIPLIAIETIYIKDYFEAIFFGFFIDILYSVQYPFPYIAMMSATGFVLVVMYIKTKIRT